MTKIKCVVVGQPGVGKTTLITRYISNSFPDQVPNVTGTSSKDLTVDDKSVTLELWDTDCSEEQDRNRPKSYPGTDVFLICYSITSRSSFDDVTNRWVPEVKHHVAKAPMLIVGLRTDLRNDPETLNKIGSAIPTEEGDNLAKQLGAKEYLECSAKTGDGIIVVFDTAVSAYYLPPKKRRYAIGRKPKFKESKPRGPSRTDQPLTVKAPKRKFWRKLKFWRRRRAS